MLRDAKNRIGWALLLVALGGCRCGAPVLSYYTDVRYTPNGQALLVAGKDGIYVAVPPTEDPKRVTEDTCGSGTSSNLGCVRLSGDGTRFVALINPRNAGSTTVHDLMQFGVGDNSGVVTGKVAADVIDAAFSPDGRELVWAAAGEEAGTVAIHRLAPAGPELLVPSIAVGESLAAAMHAVVVTNYGVAYPRQVYDSVEVWFKPVGDEYVNLGRLPEACAGAQFGACVMVSPDGASIAWQEVASAIIHVFRAQKLVDLPLGQGYAFGFTRTGSYALRMDVSPDMANVQNVDTARVVRSVEGATTGDISADGEMLAWTVLESQALKTSRLFIGWSRRDGQDQDYGVFEAAAVNPLRGAASGLGTLRHAFTGDARYAIVAAKGEAGQAKLVSVNAATSEQKELGAFSCTGCCMTAPAGSLLACLPGVTNGSASGPVAVELYDPGSGLKTVASEKAVDADFVFDGSGIVVQEYGGDVPEVKAATKDGRVTSHGLALHFAVSPSAPQVALISETGTLSVEGL